MIKQLISVICVNFNTEDDILLFLDSIPTSSNMLHIYIVDNSHTIKDNTLLFETCAILDYVTIMAPPTNLGYYGGAEYALKKHRQNILQSEWIAISNPDITFSSDFFEELKKLEIGSDVGAIAPKIINRPSNTDSNPYMLSRPSKKTIQFYIHLNSNKYLYFMYNIMHIIKKSLINKNDNSNNISIYAAQGSFILFSKHYFLAGGDFDFDGFLFAEEIFVAEEMRRLNLSILFEGSLQINHIEHASTSLLPNNKISGFIRESYEIIYKDYFL